ncbi:hypothetical protein EDD85DRAFT_962097 [Armillaria nabsnona]|nr:hypothetical protein EDD85DRAFT_962097 [Armillaria nabsnona]
MVETTNSRAASPTHPSPEGDFDFPGELEPLVVPADIENIDDESVQEVIHPWPTCIPLYTFARHANLRERRDQALDILKLSSHVGNSLRFTHTLMYNQYTGSFSTETMMLDTLLTHILMCTTTQGEIVYKLKEDLYRDLHTRFTTRHAMALNSLSAHRYSNLRIPTWGVDITKGLTANDFEVYALHFRIRTEHFINMLDECHDWFKLGIHQILEGDLMAAQCDADQACIKIEEEETLVHKSMCASSYQPQSDVESNQESSEEETRNPNNMDPDPDPSDGGSSHHSRCSHHNRPRQSLHHSQTSPQLTRSNNSGIHFDTKLKMGDVPTWDGNPDTIVTWILKVNDIASMSDSVFKDLGCFIPKRLQGDTD